MENSGKSKNIYSMLLEFLQKGKSCALAVVTSSSGSTPQVPGSTAVVGEEGLLAGTVGGGIVEYLILQSASEQLKNKQSGYFSFNLDNDIHRAEEAICGGSMNILVDANPERDSAVFRQISHSLQNHQHGVLVTLIIKAEPMDFTIERTWVTESLPEKMDPVILHQVSEMLSQRKTGEFREIRQPQTGNEQIILLETIVPSPQLVIAGAGHVGKAVSQLGQFLGFEVTVWDDRPEYANHLALPDADHILTGPFQDSLQRIRITPDTYIIIVTRGHKNDAEVLKEWINSNAAYIGMMGSRTKVALVRGKFISNGWATIDQWNNVFTPIGLPIGAKTVREIAVSIVAQLVQLRNKAPGNG